MAFYDKIKWILGILLVFFLIVTTNLIDRNNFVRVRDSAVTMYEDRLVANDLIFEMSRSIQAKEIAAIKFDSTFFLQRNSLINMDIQDFVSRFEQTKLTDDEVKLFNDLKNNLQLLKNHETAFIHSKFDDNAAMIDLISTVKENLYDLSKIQLNEGRRQMSISQRAIDTVELFTQIEIYLLIFLAIVIQIIILYKPKAE